ncbi:thiamine-binding protein [Aquihabitans daechungensis]|uniref:thiamine-binding protein n=1 Tax=Aquihabitans daechungensis TaxID=1052257 RepID=UPI003BA0AA16
MPRPSGTDDDPHAFVEAAIAAIGAAEVHHEVSALGTTLEGSPDEVWAVLRAAHEATLAVGATFTISFIKLAEGVDDGGPTMDRLTAKFRD